MAGTMVLVEIIFVNEGEPWPTDDDMNVSENEENCANMSDNDRDLDAAVGAEVEIGVNRGVEEEGERPLPESARNNDDDESSFRWWDEFDGNSSDSNAELDVAEGPTKLQAQANLYLMSLSGHLAAHSSGILVVAEGGIASKEGDGFWEQGAEEDLIPSQSTERLRESHEEGSSSIMY
ncbi:uncharacterized protein [Nerophis lumbriciformis]|uniref:uncharacterized protein isoform X2 n=1 Tax=Nerophis lumbriciformis TaxID=546530 RepID=UPI003BAA1CF0